MGDDVHVLFMKQTESPATDVSANCEVKSAAYGTDLWEVSLSGRWLGEGVGSGQLSLALLRLGNVRRVMTEPGPGPVRCEVPV